VGLPILSVSYKVFLEKTAVFQSTSIDILLGLLGTAFSELTLYQQSGALIGGLFEFQLGALGGLKLLAKYCSV
jgi:hypothetical protein